MAGFGEGSISQSYSHRSYGNHWIKRELGLYTELTDAGRETATTDPVPETATTTSHRCTVELRRLPRSGQEMVQHYDLRLALAPR
jgi:hypothetical protein